MNIGKAAQFSFIAVLTATVFSTNLWASSPKIKVIYGNDNRLDLYQVNDSMQLKLADSTVALVKSSDLVLNSNKKSYTITAEKFGTEAGLCADEPFFNQPAGAFCSGSLVAPNIIITAGHCITNQSECDDVKFVFNFAVKTENQSPTQIVKDDVVGCKSIIRREEDGEGADYAVIKLTRAITHHQPLEINRANDLTAGSKIGVIGHPSGLPTKVAFDASVRKVSSNGFFVANLDTYGGNSGSAVFNETTGKVEGILVRGETDFIYDYNLGCRRSNVCSSTGCRGEDVTSISRLVDLIP